MLIIDLELGKQKCSNAECPGSINANRFVFLQVAGCAVSNLGFPCSDCNLVHYWLNAEPRLSKDGKRIFWRDGKAIKEEPIPA
jgi:hypothetical protein